MRACIGPGLGFEGGQVEKRPLTAGLWAVLAQVQAPGVGPVVNRYADLAAHRAVRVVAHTLENRGCMLLESAGRAVGEGMDDIGSHAWIGIGGERDEALLDTWNIRAHVVWTGFFVATRRTSGSGSWESASRRSMAEAS
jgi:hypothetical protein